MLVASSDGEVRRVDGDGFGVGELRAGLGLVTEGGPDEHQLRPGVAEVVRDLALLEQRVHRHGDRPDAQDRVVQDREVRHIGQHESDPVTGLNAAFLQQPCGSRAVRVQLGVGHGRIVEADRDVVRVGLRRAEQIGSEVHCAHS